MEKILAVYDVDTGYAQRFADVVNRKEKTPFTVVPFTTMELLLEYAGKHRIELLLISASVPKEQVEQVGAGSVVTLSEGEMVTPSEGEYPAVYKYQSADSLIREVMTRYCDQPSEGMFVVLGSRARVLGIYSPVGRCLKTSFALTLGQQLSGDGKTLYVGFEEFSGMSQLVGGGEKGDLSDVLYFLRQDRFDVVRLRSLTDSWKDMDYIAPVRYPEDLEQLSGEEAAELIEKLASETGYDYVVVDVGRPARNLIPVLDCCDVIYMPVKEDMVSLARLEEFFTYLKAAGRRDLEEKIRRLRLPSRVSIRRGSGYMEQLIWGELGDYVRKMLKGGTGR